MARFQRQGVGPEITVGYLREHPIFHNRRGLHSVDKNPRTERRSADEEECLTAAVDAEGSMPGALLHVFVGEDCK